MSVTHARLRGGVHVSVCETVLTRGSDSSRLCSESCVWNVPAHAHAHAHVLFIPSPDQSQAPAHARASAALLFLPASGFRGCSAVHVKGSFWLAALKGSAGACGSSVQTELRTLALILVLDLF